MEQGRNSADGDHFHIAGPLSNLDVDVAVLGKRARVTLRGELDLAASPVVEHAVQDVCGQDCERLVIDVSGLTYCDSSGVRALVNAAHECRDCDTRMIVSGANGAVRRVFELIHAADLFDVSDGFKAS